MFPGVRVVQWLQQLNDDATKPHDICVLSRHMSRDLATRCTSITTDRTRLRPVVRHTAPPVARGVGLMDGPDIWDESSGILEFILGMKNRPTLQRGKTGLPTVLGWYSGLVRQDESSYDMKILVQHSFGALRVRAKSHNTRTACRAIIFHRGSRSKYRSSTVFFPTEMRPFCRIWIVQ